MALGINSIWEARATATAANVNGSGFNPSSATLALTDLIATAASGQSATPTVSSATYTFVAGDVSSYLFIQSGTTFVPGWYQITAVAAGVATLAAAIGQVVKYTSGAVRSFALNTADGCATAASPTAGVFTIDYTQQNAAEFALTALTSAGAGNVVISAAAVPTMIGNIARVNSGTNFTVGWFEVTAVTTGVDITFSTNQAGTAITTGVGAAGALNIGGAASLSSSAGATDDLYFENGAGTNGSGAHIFFIKNGAYTAMGPVITAAVGGTLAPVRIIGYNLIRTDGFASDLGSNRPVLTFGANALTTGSNWNTINIITMMSGITGVTQGIASVAIYCKFINNSITTDRNAVTQGDDTLLIMSEVMSYRGNGIETAAQDDSKIIYSLIHNSVIGYNIANVRTGLAVLGNIISNNVTDGIDVPIASVTRLEICQNTFYGAENKLGNGLDLNAGVTDIYTYNNIFYGFVNPITHGAPQSVAMADYNDYFNNTNANTNYPLGVHALAIDPQFVNVVQRTGATATTTAGNHLVQVGATFVTWGITPGVDVVTLISGTGTTNGVHYSILTVDSETQITTGETLTANATADHVWQITQGHNFEVGNDLLKGTGFPGTMPEGLSTGYMTPGALQAQASASSGGPPFIIGG